mmetsp:Transcript_649/g.2165  ORF Transcript_649/g.2165 Transcript_649/m.2165 type:complete len:197 (+) Transcript_649:342-932(+)
MMAKVSSAGENGQSLMDHVMGSDGLLMHGLENRALGAENERCGRAECVFCRVVAGLEDSEVVYSTDKVLGILDKYPVAKGHCLVLLRSHRRTMDDMEPEEAKVLFEAVHLVARAAIPAMKAQGFNIGMNNGRAAGQTVSHVHVHIIPRYNDDDFWCTRRPQTIPAGTALSRAEMHDLATIIRNETTRLSLKHRARL